MKHTLKQLFIASLFVTMFNIVFTGNALAAVYTVNSTADGVDANTGDSTCETSVSGECTLRAALEQVEADNGGTIEFNIPNSDPNCTDQNLCTISPTSQLPKLTGSVTIDGYTQTDASPNTTNFPNAMDAVLKIEINGGSAGSGVYGLHVQGSGNIIKGLVIRNFTNDGIYLNDPGNNAPDNNKVQGNFIGTDPAGENDNGNNKTGVWISSGDNNIIGTDGDGTNDAAERNLISGNNQHGVRINNGGATGNRIAGNFIGTDKDGTTDIGNNWDGVDIGTPSNIIGTNSDGNGDSYEGNLISGNNNHGITIGSGGDGTTIMGNYIGLNAAGTGTIGNTQNGVQLDSGSSSDSTRTYVGTDGDGTNDANERNYISGNGTNDNNHAQVNTVSHYTSVRGNYLGLAPNGTTVLGSSFGSGIRIQVNANNSVFGTDGNGTSDDLEGNVICGMNTDGIYTVSGPDSFTVAGNLIGITPSDADCGNDRHGIWIQSGTINATIGGDTGDESNTIAYNGDASNEFGIRLQGSATDNVQILRNSFHDNQNEGIRLDTDANNNQAAPSIASQALSGSNINITGTATANDTIQLFLADSSDAEGKTFLGSTTSDGSGDWTITITSNKQTGNKLVATTTNSTNGTSQFSSSYTITNIDATPTAQTVAASEDVDKTITLAGTDANGDSLTFRINSLPANGALYQTSDGTTRGTEITSTPTTVSDSSARVIYVSAENASGNGHGNFEFSANDGTTWSLTAEVTVNVSAVNDLPTTSNASIGLNQETNKNINLSASDVENDDLTYSIVSNPSKGTITSINSATGAVVYRPNVGETGSDSFTFKANDGTGDSNTSTINLTISSLNRTVQFLQSTSEAAESAGTHNLTIQLSAASAYAVSIPVSTGGGATANSDYSVSSSLPLSIAAGQTTATLALSITNDTIDENNETITLTIGTPTNASKGSTSVHTVTINDNDNPPTVTLSATPTSFSENSGSSTVKATLSSASGKNVSMNFSYSGTAGSSEYNKVNSLTINAGQTSGTFTVSGVDDSTDENNETIIIGLTNLSNLASSGNSGITLTLTDDDEAESDDDDSDNSNDDSDDSDDSSDDEEEEETGPFAIDAGKNFRTVEGAFTRLAGSTSGQSDSPTYQWTQTSGTTVELAGATTLTPSFTAPSNGREQLVFTLTATNAGTTLTDTVTVRVSTKQVNLSSEDNDVVQRFNRKIVAAGGGRRIFSEIGDFAGDRRRIITFNDNQELVMSSANNVPVMLIGDILLVSDPFINNSTGKLVAIDMSTVSQTSIDLVEDDIDFIAGVVSAQGSQVGDLFGHQIKIGDVNADGSNDIIVSAPGTTYGHVYLLDRASLEALSLFVGSSASPLKTTKIVVANINGVVGDEAIFGVKLSSSSSLSLVTEEEIDEMSDDELVLFAESAEDEVDSETSYFTGITASSSLPSVFDLDEEDPDFSLDVEEEASFLDQGDVNGDEVDDLISGHTASDCYVNLYFGQTGVGVSTTPSVTTDSLLVEGDCFTTLTSAEVTGDEFDDIILGYPAANGGKGYLYVLPGQESWGEDDLTLDEAIEIAGSSGQEVGSSLLLADSDGDGNLDIITTNNAGNSVAIDLRTSLDESSSGGSAATGDAAGAGGAVGCSLNTGHNGHSSGLTAGLLLILLGFGALRVRKNTLASS